MEKSQDNCTISSVMGG